MLVAVIDAGTSSVRASLVDEDLVIRARLEANLALARSRSGEAGFDAQRIADIARELLEALAAVARPDAIAIATQRASAVLFDLTRGRALAPGIGWEDARTAGRCLELARLGIAVSPSESATKFEVLLTRAELPAAARVGTLDAWLVAALGAERTASTDPTNAAVTGLTTRTATAWDPERLAHLAIPFERLVPIEATVGVRAHMRLRGTDVPIVVVIGDQQASHAGQRSPIKLTIGTSAVADGWLGTSEPPVERRGPNGTFPVVLVEDADTVGFGLEAFWSSAGSTVAWLADLGTLRAPEEAAEVAALAHGAVPLVVPAFAGAGAPVWDFGARGVIERLAPRTGAPELVRGVLEGLAHVGYALLGALRDDAIAVGQPLPPVRPSVDGRAGQNPVVVGSLATLLGTEVERAAIPEATTLGAARLALGLPREALPPGDPVFPGALTPHHTHVEWRNALDSARGAIPALSAVRF
jgi:glycerol kinase